MFPSFLPWAQAAPPTAGASSILNNALQWLFVLGEPSVTVPGILGGLITWARVVGLVSLIAWILTRLVLSAQHRPGVVGRRPGWIGVDLLGLLGLVAGLLGVFLQVVEDSGKRKFGSIGGVPTVEGLILAGLVLVALWAEIRLWTSLARRGKRSDLGLLAAMHLAAALGLVVAANIGRFNPQFAGANVAQGVRMGGTYMGLVVLAWTIAGVSGEVLSVRPRRLYAIAWQCWTESFRRMWAPWVVLIVFGIILAFFDWFVPGGTAEMGRSYVGSLMFLAAILMMLMITILSPISLPNDIRQQTIYTVVSKPVRRLELIWGRMIGYMALVSVLLAIFGGVSLVYLYRNVDAAIAQSVKDAARYRAMNRPDFARQKDEQAEQLRTRMSARQPVKGSLIFIDSKNKQVIRGIDVGSEMEFRSHIEGATPSKAIWRFGVVPDPTNSSIPLDRSVPVSSLLVPGTIEAAQDEVYNLSDDAARAAQAQAAAGGKVAEAGAEAAKLARIKGLIADAQKRLKDLTDRERKYQADARAQKDATAAAALRRSARELHSPPIPIEMTFTVYRTTKGELGVPVYARMQVISPRRPRIEPFNEVFAVHEYFTSKRSMPAAMLAGSGGDLRVEIQCVTPNQYLGMAESDLFLVENQGGYRVNFLKGLLGVWLQAMVLTAVGVFAGTFLSWPVAFVTTIFFLLAGYAAVGTLYQFSQRLMVGGGPFESLIRMVGHQSMEVELAATPGVVIARSLDQIVTPVLERLVYVVPNLTALDVSNTVADGFAVTGHDVLVNFLLGLGYALPFSVAAYYILKNREVAA